MACSWGTLVWSIPQRLWWQKSKARWCEWAPGLLKTLGSAGGAPLSNADLNFSGNNLEDCRFIMLNMPSEAIQKDCNRI